MIQIPFLHDVVVLFSAALLVIAFSSRFKIPPIVGFLITGTAVGPHGFALIDDIHLVEVFAELGVVFLLFIVGLELSPNRLKRLARIILAGGSIQAGTTVIVIALAAYAIGYAANVAVYFSFLVCLSSTAIVLKLYSDRRELETPQGEVSMGILLFQDFLIVPLLLVVPVLAGVRSASAADFALHFGGGMLIVGAVFACGRFVLPHILRVIVHTRIRELIVIFSLFACLAAAVLTESFGFSLALGAFVAGILIAETDYRYQVLAETAPFRDVFNSMFFISVGMLIQLDFALQNAGMILIVVMAVLIIKALLVVAAVTALSYPWRTRLLVALSLAQIGEFSFVLIHVGESNGLLDPWHYQMAIAVVVLTMLATPGLIALGPALIKRRREAAHASSPEPAAEAPATTHSGHVVIVGFGLNGRYVAQALKENERDYVIIELNGRTVRQSKRDGEPILFGDATRHEILEHAGIHNARVAVFAITDPNALRDSIKRARAMAPELYIIARARFLADSEDLEACGADVVIVEEVEASIKLLGVTLTTLGLPDRTIREAVLRVRKDVYPLLRDLPGPLPENVMQALETLTTKTFQVDASHPHCGETLRQMDLGRKTGARVISITRGEANHANPSADMPLEAGDILVLVGSHEEIQNAEAALQFADVDRAI